MSGFADVLRERARAGLPPVEGEVRLGGLQRPVEVRRDRWGVPHVYAEDLHDLFFAGSYVLTSERLFQQDFLLRLCNGRLSSVLGEFGVGLDRFFRTLGFHRAGGAITAELDDLSLEIVHASIEGARSWFDTMPARPIEYEVLALDPEPYPQGDEGIAYGLALEPFMSWMLGANWDCELLRAEIVKEHGWEVMRALFPDVATEASVVTAGKDGGGTGPREPWELLREAFLPASGQGSNNWVVAGSRSVTGKPLLANDPHIVAQVPSIWFEIHLSSPQVQVAGVTLPLLAGIQIGHGERVAWGVTAVSGDSEDLYLERLNEDRTASLYDGDWEPLTVHREEIQVRGRAEPEILEVLETRHGPILDSYLVGTSPPEVVAGGVTETYAMRWTGASMGASPSTLLRMAAAGDVEDFREALRGWHSPGLNFVFADVDGAIGYQCAGAYPIRGRGDGTVPVPGWTSEYEWDGFIPFDDLPRSRDPGDGFLATANQKIHDDSYPHLIGRDFFPPHRARRIVELLTATERHSVETFARMQSDTVSNAARQIVPHLVGLTAASPRQEAALELLRAWDCDVSADSVPGCIYEVWCKHLAEAILLPKLGRQLFDHYYARRQWTVAFQYQVLPNLLAFPTGTWFGADGRQARDVLLRRTLDRALDELTRRLGEDMSRWTWGAVHRIHFRGQLSIIPELGELLEGGEAPWGGDEQTLCQGMFEPGGGTYDVVVVPSWRQILDLSNWDASVGTHTVGQSGNPASPHFKDLFPLWSTGRYHPMPFSREAVEAVTESTLSLLPEDRGGSA